MVSIRTWHLDYTSKNPLSDGPDRNESFKRKWILMSFTIVDTCEESRHKSFVKLIVLLAVEPQNLSNETICDQFIQYFVRVERSDAVACILMRNSLHSMLNLSKLSPSRDQSWILGVHSPYKRIELINLNLQLSQYKWNDLLMNVHDWYV